MTLSREQYRKMTVVLPALNEIATIGPVIDAVPHGCRVLVGDNGSTDGTGDVARKRGATVILVRNKGKGNVIKELIKRIETPMAIVADSDGTYPVADGTRLALREMIAGYDAVLLYRKYRYPGAMSRFHVFGNTMLSIMTSVVYGVQIRDVVSGMWAFKTDMLVRLCIENGSFTPDVDFVTGVLMSGIKFCQIPISYYPRANGSASKLRLSHAVVIANRIVTRRFRKYG